ncbi:MAG: hypothetical protein Q7S22_07295 [Candidatus Micrarchaeota archaeon]|nr:hypothetical protein [Candidatus Micrarchaeota archaeon]
MSTLLEDILNELEIRPTNELLSHEQTIAPNLKRLKETMLNIGHLVDPLIVDKVTGTVLDGNHRLKVLEIIECPHAVCQLVDYKNDKIKVGTWLPTFNEPLSLVTKGEIKTEAISYEDGLKAVNGMRAPFMAVTKNNGKMECKLINPGNYKIKEIVEEQNYILTSAIKGIEPAYIPDEQLVEQVEKGSTVFFRRSYTKDEIVQTAKAHHPLPPKSTRHHIPDRIIRLNMKLGWLHESKEGATKYLRDMLAQRIYTANVRRYTESVIVIY